MNPVIAGSTRNPSRPWMPDRVRHDTPCATSPSDHRWLSINTATVRKCAASTCRCPKSSKPAPRRGIRAISPWRDQVAAAGLDTISQAGQGTWPGTLRLLPRRHVPGGRCAGPARRARRQPPRRRRGPRTQRRLPGAGGGRPARRAGGQAGAQGHRAGAQPGARWHRRNCWSTRAPPTCRWRSSRCIPCTRPTAPASTRWSRRWTSATNSTRGVAQARSGVAVDVYHVWWDPKLQAADRARGQGTPAGVPCLRLAHADHRPAQRPRNDGRRRDRHPADPRLDGGMQGFAGYSEVEIFSTGNWWQRDCAEVLDTCIAAAPQRGLNADQPATERTAATAGRLVAVPNSISPDSWPPSSMTTLP